MTIRASVFALLLLLASGCARAPRALIDTPATDPPFAVDAWLAEHPIGAEQNILAVPIRHSASSSTHIIQVRHGETPHRHATHDLTVTMLRGCGTLHLGARTLPMRPGDVAVVPMGVAHYFVNDGSSPSVALATFAPAFDGTDQVPVQP